MEETFLNTVKAIYNKPTASITLKREKLESFPPRSATKNHYSLSSLPLRKFRKSHPALLGGKKRVQIGSKEVTLSLLQVAGCYV